MHTSYAKLAFFLATSIPLAFGKAIPQAYPINTCQGADVYENSNDEVLKGDKVKAYVGSKSCDASETGCTVSKSSSFSVGHTVEVGTGLNIGSIISAGVTASVSETTEKGDEQGMQKDCQPGDYQCALILRPAMVRITGIKTVRYLKSDGTCGNRKEDYVVLVPAVGQDGTSGEGGDICACNNYEGWANPGAPSTVCPSACY